MSEVDRDVERTLRDAIAGRFPEDGVCGEETGSEPGTSGREWVLDPIDGTALFVRGIPLWTTLIALREDGRVLVGIADAPALGQRYVAVAGRGAWRNGRPLRVSDVRALADAFVLYTADGSGAGSGDPIALAAGRAAAARGLSDAWGQLLVAQGSAEALVERGPCFEWDWAAPSLIVTEAGGRVSALDGRPPSAGCGLLVSNARVHDELLAAIAERGAATAP